MFNIEKDTPKEMANGYAYTIFRPGGNDTALVLGIQNDPEKRKRINDLIMLEHPNVEQVGFISKEGEAPELMMAGEEFCGNATRSTAYFLLDGKPGELQIKVSGVGEKLKAGVDGDGNAWAQMPIYRDPKKISKLNEDSYMVEMEGITHIVEKNKFKEELGQDEIKKYGLDKLKSLGFTEKYPASGVMLLTETGNDIKMEPVVWVKKMETLFYETACGSGTTAVGLVEALKKEGDVNIPVVQPSGKRINIEVNYDGNQFNGAKISGQIEQLTPVVHHE